MYNFLFRKRSKNNGTPHFLFKKKKQKAGGQSLKIKWSSEEAPPERKIKTHEEI